MKTWLSSLIAIALGLCAALLLGDYTFYSSVLEFSEAVVIKVGVFILYPLAFFAIASGIASLRKKTGNLSKVIIMNILWSLISAIVLCAVTVLALYFKPVGFPSLEAPSAAISAQELLLATKDAALALNPFNFNPLVNTFSSSTWLLPIFVTALLFGLATKADDSLVQPAYVVMSSVSEVMFRLSAIVAKLGWVFLFILSAKLFKTTINQGYVFQFAPFFLEIGVIFLFLVFIVIPLLYAIFSRFKFNSYLHILRSLCPAFLGLFSGNYLFSLTGAFAVSRSNLGVQKKVCGASLPLSSFITKAGSATMGTICICCLYNSLTGNTISLSLSFLVAGFCILASLLSSLHLGYETYFICLVALSWLGFDLQGSETGILLFLPVINGMGVFIDILLSQLAVGVEGLKVRSAYSVDWIEVI